jgi:hypothetical protein
VHEPCPCHVVPRGTLGHLARGARLDRNGQRPHHRSYCTTCVPVRGRGGHTHPPINRTRVRDACRRPAPARVRGRQPGSLWVCPYGLRLPTALAAACRCFARSWPAVHGPPAAPRGVLSARGLSAPQGDGSAGAPPPPRHTYVRGESIGHDVRPSAIYGRSVWSRRRARPRSARLDCYGRWIIVRPAGMNSGNEERRRRAPPTMLLHQPGRGP